MPSNSKKIAIATCVKLPEPDVDEELLLAALEKRGASVRMLPWDDASAAATADEIVVIRSTWNYFEDVDRFLSWIDRTSKITTVWNPSSLVASNAKKTYLRDLEAKGIHVVPTEYAMHTDKARRRARDVMRERQWNAIVVKPVVSAGSFLTQRFDDSDSSIASAEAFLDRILADGRDAMIQCWMPTVDTYGERSLVWIDGEITHAVRKAPRFIGGAESVSASDVPIADDERAFATRVITSATELTGSLLYGRVDMVRDNDRLRLMELELIEPSLFLKQAPHALDRLADAILARASKAA